MEISHLFGGIYKGKKVLITGHTGFKGSWLAYWLHRLGAEVHGIALDPPTDPDHFSSLKLPIDSSITDITHKEELEAVITRIDPGIIFHLAAQPIVRKSFEQPYETYMTNIMGTVNVLDVCRKLPSVKALVNVTSDKCYDNREWIWGYREDEPMGGKDPYSSSKGCSELVTAAFRHSYFRPDMFGNTHHLLIASARAGNVIGGGDWAADRIVPDLVKAAASKTTLFLRYPGATRPWQHVLEPLSGYLTLGWKLLEGNSGFAHGWNFGPDIRNNVAVIDLVKEAASVWPSLQFDFEKKPQPHEAGYLMLDSTMAKKILRWEPVWDFRTTVKRTIEWYLGYYENSFINTAADLENYISDATEKSLPWTNQ